MTHISSSFSYSGFGQKFLLAVNTRTWIVLGLLRSTCALGEVGRTVFNRSDTHTHEEYLRKSTTYYVRLFSALLSQSSKHHLVGDLLKVVLFLLFMWHIKYSSSTH